MNPVFARSAKSSSARIAHNPARIAHKLLSLFVILTTLFNPVLAVVVAAAPPPPSERQDYPARRDSLSADRAPGNADSTNTLPFSLADLSEAMGRDEATYQIASNGEGAWQADTPGSLSSSFTSAGIEIRNGDDFLRLTLREYGYGTQLQATRPDAPEVTGNRVFYEHGNLTEWYVNGAPGLEQGFTLASRPAGRSEGEPLTLIMDLESNMNTEVNADGNGLRLTRPDSDSVLHYSGLIAFDATGQDVPAWLELDTSPQGTRLLVRVDDAAATYPLTIDPWLFIKQAGLK